VTKISYSIPQSASGEKVQLKVFDMLGNLVSVLVNRNQEVGTYNIDFDGTNLASGIYFYELRSGKFFQSKKMLLLK
jgi:hypothetical protein